MPELRITNYNMAAARLIAAALFVPFLVGGGFLMVAIAFEEGIGLDSLVPVGGGLLFLLGAAAFGIMGARAVLSVTFGEAVDVRTLLGRRRYAWDEVTQLGIASQGSAVEVLPSIGIPVASHVVLYVLLRGDEVFGLQLKTNPEELSALAEVLAAHGRGNVLQPLAA